MTTLTTKSMQESRVRKLVISQSTVCDTRQYAIRDSVVDPLLDNSKPQRSLDELQLIELLQTLHVQARLKHSWAVIVSHVVTKHLKEF